MSLLAAGLTSIIHRVLQTKRVNHMWLAADQKPLKTYKKVKHGFGLLCATKRPKLSPTLILSQQASTDTVSVH